MTRQHILSKIDSIQKSCAELIDSAKSLSESNNQSHKKLAYEISVSVATIMAEQIFILKELQSMGEEITANNGYGGLAD